MSKDGTSVRLIRNLRLGVAWISGTGVFLLTRYAMAFHPIEVTAAAGLFLVATLWLGTRSERRIPELIGCGAGVALVVAPYWAFVGLSGVFDAIEAWLTQQ